MCGRFAVARRAHELAEALHASLAPGAEAFDPADDVVPGREAPILVAVPERRLGLARFGMSAKDLRLLVNARAETLEVRPRFAEAARRRRCLVPVDAFFESRRDGARRVRFRVRALEPALLLLAGLYDVERDPSTATRRASFVVVTRPACPPISEIHDRMPLLVPHDFADRWLDPRAASVAEIVRALLDAAPIPLTMHADDASPRRSTIGFRF